MKIRRGWRALTPIIGHPGTLGATAISLSSARAWGEVMGWRNALEAKMTEAPA